MCAAVTQEVIADIQGLQYPLDTPEYFLLLITASRGSTQYRVQGLLRVRRSMEGHSNVAVEAGGRWIRRLWCGWHAK
jgi:hypothetical protein